MCIEKELENMDEKELRKLIVKVFDSIKSANKPLDESLRIDKNLNIVHINKDKQGRYSTDAGQQVARDKHGFFVVVEKE